MKTIYRISDNSYKKIKLPCCTKTLCLDNFLDCFKKIDYVIADNCSDKTIEYLNEKKLNVLKTNLGNAGSFMHSLEIAMSQDVNEEEIFYFVEDDYIHNSYCKNLSEVIESGLNFADYVTLYDHPDKYSDKYDFGEICKVRNVKKQHWKNSISTTMTFAAKVKTLKQDYDIFYNICHGEFHPNDHEIFLDLKNKKNRNLYVAIPGLCVHADLSGNLDVECFDFIESWVFDVIEEKSKIIFKEKTGIELFSIHKFEGIKKLLMLEQMMSQIL